MVIRTGPGAAPIRVRDVATVRDGEAFRSAVATADGAGETVYGMVQMVAGGNAHEVTGHVKEELTALRRRLPAGVQITPFYDRADLVDRVLKTVARSLLEGGVIVIVVLLFFLGDFAAGLVVATAIPLAMLGAFALMNAFGLSGNLMSLGAIDFGLVVDGAVVVVEGALATMARQRLAARDALLHEGDTVGSPIAFGVLLIALVYVPVLLLDGVEGRMFRPMAWTVLFALGTALVLSFTWIPVVASFLLRRAHAHESWALRQLRRPYERLLTFFMARPRWAVVVAVGLSAAGIVAAGTRGAEFVPRLEEGDLVIQVTRPPSVSLREAAAGTTAIERVLRAYPEVLHVVSRTGSPDVATGHHGRRHERCFRAATAADDVDDGVHA